MEDKNGVKTSAKLRNNVSPMVGKATQFSTNKQPSPSLKKEGWKRRKSKQALVQAVLNKKGIEVIEKLALDIGIDLSNDQYGIDFTMTLRQIEKAMNEADTRAYIAVMDRLVGKPKRPTKAKV